MKNYLIILFSVYTLIGNAQIETEYLTKEQIKNDLKVLDKILQEKSSYQGLNGYDYRADFNTYLDEVNEKSITTLDFELFLSRTIGKIGDRHSNIKGDQPRDLLYLPLSFAPMNGRVLVLDYNSNTKEYAFSNQDYPYLKSINRIPIDKILSKIIPGDLLAPDASYNLRSVRELRDIQTIFKHLKMDLPNPLPITLTNDKEEEMVVQVELVERKRKGRLWDERFNKSNFFLLDEQSNDPEIIKQFFEIKDNIAYIQIVKMLNKEDSPVFFEYLNQYMSTIKNTDALIIDVRDNGGGRRDLIQELAGYFIHPDSLFVVNATRQRGVLPLNKELKERLHHRYLYARNESDNREKDAIDTFMSTFSPMYKLSNDTYSDYHYYVLNGQKITKNKYHYDKPIYILANERSFSAASVLVSVFKGLPNITIVGVNTDGSSGNSERFELPNSGLKGKISTMVSFQKDGQILDGIGTAPDIKIERNLNQIFFKEDYQLDTLNDLIKNQ